MFSHKLMNGIQRQTIVRLPATLMICSIVLDDENDSGIVYSETLAVGIGKADSLLEVDPEDLRHLFFETMKELFYAIRKFNPEDLDEADIDEFMTSADLLSGTIHSIERRIKVRTQTKKPLEGLSKEKEPEQDQRPIVERDAQGRIIYRFK